jgi:tetratricopeptide (TPR) repeat protein
VIDIEKINQIIIIVHLVCIEKSENIIFNFIILIEIVENIINVFKLLGQGLQHLSQFECRQAIELFESISLKHLDTPWALAHLANCYYHLHEYQKSSLIYRELRTKYPYHIDGLEYYSTVLWHLKDDIALATLAHELTETDRKHPAVSVIDLFEEEEQKKRKEKFFIEFSVFILNICSEMKISIICFRRIII